jgi:hypothetical protein
MPINFLPTEVNPSGLTALIENLGRDCHPTQFLREFAKNAIEACQRSPDSPHKVIVDFNSSLYERSRIHKISFIDTGDGMSANQMLSLLNNLSASGNVKNVYKNYGVGAKISAMTRNHAGIQYESWKDDVGHMIFIKYLHEEGVYGVQGVQGSDGQTQYAISLSSSQKPKEIKKHGTRVTLWGMFEPQDTMLPPTGVGGIRESWLGLYLNTRFFRIPNGIEMSARIGYYRENNPRHNYLLNIKGQKAILDEKSHLKGFLKLSDANVYWWVMPKDVEGHGRELVKGHTALINEDEVFDISDSRSNRAAYFGVIFGRDRVIIYLEPDNVMQNTTRTDLVRPDGSNVTWEKWQDEFRLKMPAELKLFLDELQNEIANESHTDSIKERLKELKELYKLSRYKVNPKGVVFADPNQETEYEGGSERMGDPNLVSISTTPKLGPKPGPLSNALLTALAEESVGLRVTASEPDPFPTVQWVSTAGNDSLIDRAAEYIQTQNVILANSDYQGLRDLINYFAKNYVDVPEVLKTIEDEVKQAFEQALTECVAGALSFKNRPHWNPSDFEKAISREALTTAVAQRYWMVSYIKRVLGSKIRAFSEAAVK